VNGEGIDAWSIGLFCYSYGMGCRIVSSAERDALGSQQFSTQRLLMRDGRVHIDSDGWWRRRLIVTWPLLGFLLLLLVRVIAARVELQQDDEHKRHDRYAHGDAPREDPAQTLDFAARVRVELDGDLVVEFLDLRTPG
jgi:hypothetical protein